MNSYQLEKAPSRIMKKRHLKDPNMMDRNCQDKMLPIEYQICVLKNEFPDMKPRHLKEAICLTMVLLDDQLSNTTTDTEDVFSELNHCVSTSLLWQIDGLVEDAIFASKEDVLPYLNRLLTSIDFNEKRGGYYQLLDRMFGKIQVTGRISEFVEES